VDTRAELIEGDIVDEEVCAAAVRGVDVVLHQAARVGLGKDPEDLPGYVSDNDLGTAMLLRALWRAGFEGRLVLASSMVVYGEGRYRCSAHGVVRPGPRSTVDLDAGRFDPPCPSCGAALTWSLVPEDAPVDPRSVYAATKLAQEHLCASWARQAGASVVALRYHNVYGPGLPRDTPYAGVASLFLSALLAGEPPRVFEDGAQARDFVHVDDVARANVLALGVDVPAGGFAPVNVCSGRSTTVLDMAGALASAVSGPCPVVTGEYRLGDVRHVVASPERARTLLGFEAGVSFEHGMTELAAEARAALPRAQADTTPIDVQAPTSALRTRTTPTT